MGQSTSATLAKLEKVKHLISNGETIKSACKAVKLSPITFKKYGRNFHPSNTQFEAVEPMVPARSYSVDASLIAAVLTSNLSQEHKRTVVNHLI